MSLFLCSFTVRSLTLALKYEDLLFICPQSLYFYYLTITCFMKCIFVPRYPNKWIGFPEANGANHKCNHECTCTSPPPTGNTHFHPICLNFSTHSIDVLRHSNHLYHDTRYLSRAFPLHIGTARKSSIK